ncbi:methionine/alanine import family NSS transporter small subunit [Nocardioides alcanivorans]|nr:methionine/alanine import family NSS transporter small subunit [Nocardioides alcanivorans]
MSTAGIVMMIVAIAVIWGGLVLALVNLNNSPEAGDR